MKDEINNLDIVELFKSWNSAQK